MVEKAQALKRIRADIRYPYCVELSGPERPRGFSSGYCDRIAAWIDIFNSKRGIEWSLSYHQKDSSSLAQSRSNKTYAKIASVFWLQMNEEIDIISINLKRGQKPGFRTHWPQVASAQCHRVSISAPSSAGTTMYLMFALPPESLPTGIVRIMQGLPQSSTQLQRRSKNMKAPQHFTTRNSLRLSGAVKKVVTLCQGDTNPSLD